MAGCVKILGVGPSINTAHEQNIFSYEKDSEKASADLPIIKRIVSGLNGVHDPVQRQDDEYYTNL